jgi:hypothetical protein
LSEGLLAALPGYKGPHVYCRGADPDGCAYFLNRHTLGQPHTDCNSARPQAFSSSVRPQIPAPATS